MRHAPAEVQRRCLSSSLRLCRWGPVECELPAVSLKGDIVTDPDEQLLAYYRQPAVMTSVGRHAALLEGLPAEVGALAAVAQGLLIHEHIAPAYGVTLSDERRASVHVRQVERLLDLIVAEDDAPLAGSGAAPSA